MHATPQRSPRTAGAFFSPPRSSLMNAPRFDSPDARALSPEVESQLSAALKAHSAQPSEETARTLKTAIEAAAADARARDLRSEELVLVFKAIERTSGVLLGDEKAAASRNHLIKMLLDAYYLTQPPRRDSP